MLQKELRSFLRALTHDHDVFRVISYVLKCGKNKILISIKGRCGEE